MTTSRMTLFVLLLFLASLVQAGNGLNKIQSNYSVAETADRFEAVVKKAGMTVFNRIDHAAGAEKVGKSLRPTELIIFGNPKIGTALMSSDQRAGIDLPLKALIWQGKGGKVWLGYNNPGYLFNRFGINNRDKARKKMTGALKKFSAAATGNMQ